MARPTSRVLALLELLQSGGTRTVTCFSAIDNLIKGGAGQAIQSMNIMLGVDEKTTLEDVGGYP